jgi:hypothetical protein
LFHQAIRYKEKAERLAERVEAAHYNAGLKGKLQKSRPLKWAVDAKQQSRQFSVSQLFPRLLYTFSDVIVFVLREVR